MQNIKDTFIEFLKNEHFKKELSDIIKPLGTLVYNEIYVYLWTICIFNVFFVFILLGNLFLLLKILKILKNIDLLYITKK
jgi:hypothetical protein